MRNEKEKFMLASRGSGSEVVSQLTASTAVAAEAAANAAKVRHFSEMCGWRKICLLSFVSCLSVSLSVARARNAEEMCRQTFTHILTRMRGSPILVYVVARMYVCCIDHALIYMIMFIQSAADAALAAARSTENCRVR